MLVNFTQMSWLEVFKYCSIYIVCSSCLFLGAFDIIATMFKKVRGIVREEYPAGQIKAEIIASAKVSIFELFLLLVILKTGFAKPHAFTWTRMIGSFLFCYFSFEIWFYWAHRLMHTPKFRWIHRTHHTAIMTSPYSSLCLSMTEKMSNDLGKIILPCVVGHFFPVLVEAILLYNFYNFYANVLGHCNVELLPSWLNKSFVGRFFSTATYHSLHHLKGHKNLGLFTSFCDKLFGTYDAHYVDNYQQVVESKGLTRKEVLLQAKAS